MAVNAIQENPGKYGVEGKQPLFRGSIESTPTEFVESGKLHCWKYLKNPDPDKPKKSPVDSSGKPNSHTDASIYAPLDELKRRIEAKGWGLGISLGSDGLKIGGQYLWCFDFDGFVELDGNRVDDELAPILSRVNSYTEVSPSATGCKAFFLTDKPPLTKFEIEFGSSEFAAEHPEVKKYREREIEIFSKGYFMALTGEAYAPGRFSKLRFIPETEVDDIIAAIYAAVPAGFAPKKPVKSQKVDLGFEVPEFIRADASNDDPAGTLIKAPKPYGKLKPESLERVLAAIDPEDEQAWTDTANALARVYDEVGRAYFHEYSKRSEDQYDESECDARYDRALREVVGRADGYGVNHLIELSGLDRSELEWEAPEAETADQVMTREEFNVFTDSTAKVEPELVYEEKAEEMLTPFRGAMTEIVDHILATSPKPQPELAVLAAVISMAASCPGSYSLMVGSMRLNLYGVGISESGSGKDQPRFVATSLVRKAGGKVISKPASGQALEDELVANTPMLLEVDEAAYMFQELNGKDASSSTIALARMILMLFSQSRGVYSTRAKARQGKENSSAVRHLSHPMLSMLGFCTPDKLGEVLSTANIEDGMLGRILFARGRDKVIPLFIEDIELPSSILKLAERVRLSTSDPNRETGGVCYLHEIKITETDDARSLLKVLMVQSSEKADNTKDPLTKILLIRTFEKLYRVAGVLAVWDNPEKPVINVKHLEWARRFVDTSDETVIRFCTGYLHGGQTQADASRILTIIKRVISGEYKPTSTRDKEFTKGLSTTRSLVLNKSKLAKKQFDEGIAHLVDTGKISEGVVERKNPLTGKVQSVKILTLDQECDL